MTAVSGTNVLAALMLPTAENAVVVSLFRQDPDWRLPPLWRSEFRHVLLKYVRAGILEPAQAIAIQSGCSSYDAEFVVLAEQLGCRLLTFARKLLQLFPAVTLQPSFWRTTCTSSATEQR